MVWGFSGVVQGSPGVIFLGLSREVFDLIASAMIHRRPIAHQERFLDPDDPPP